MPQSDRFRLLLPPATLFLGSLLNFWVQPMVGRTLLPFFGGTAAVWAVCLAAFQLLLLAGYLYAAAVSRLPRTAQRGIHLAVLLAAAVWAWSLSPAGSALDPAAGDARVAYSVLVQVLRLVGLPFVAVAAGSTLVQHWAASGAHDRAVYRLYSLSNAGSFVGLLLYAVGLEPFVSLGRQRMAWNTTLAIYAALAALVALVTIRRDTGRGEAPVPSEGGVAGSNPATHGRLDIRWSVLPAVSSALLVATTNHVTMQIQAMPLLWALLLSAFLASYIAGFSTWAEQRLPALRDASALMLACSPVLLVYRPNVRVAMLVILYGTALLCIVGTWLHASLFSSRPGARRLPLFYLGIAGGGVAGGAVASFVPPILFRGMWELPLLVAGLAGLVWAKQSRGSASVARARILSSLCLVGAAIVVAKGFRPCAGTVFQDRGFYGAIRVWETGMESRAGSEGKVRELVHGAVCHGMQYAAPGWRGRALTYFGPGSAAALAIANHPKRAALEPLRIGVVGLGIGSLAAYGRTGDDLRFYEIDRHVVDVATNRAWFTLLSDCPGKVEIVLGDGRKSLERELDQGMPRFDVLVLDAFSGDATPLHLLTREALALYLDRLEPDGVLALHLSNWHMDFVPLCKDIAATCGLKIRAVRTREDPAHLLRESMWVALSRREMAFTLPAGAEECDLRLIRTLPAPTDDKGRALRYLKLL
jgi:hypothetical protein